LQRSSARSRGWGWRQNTGDRRQEIECGRLEAGGWRLEAGGWGLNKYQKQRLKVGRFVLMPTLYSVFFLLHLKTE
jgi:hypothetical protein